MKIPKNYLHDRTILVLLAVNAALFLLSSLGALFGVNENQNLTSIVAYRDVSKVQQISGPTSDLYQFAIFAVLVTASSVVLSLKLYPHRRHLAVGILALNTLLLIMSIVIFNALTKTL